MKAGAGAALAVPHFWQGVTMAPPFPAVNAGASGPAAVVKKLVAAVPQLVCLGAHD